jgi:hypothetical protein
MNGKPFSESDRPEPAGPLPGSSHDWHRDTVTRAQASQSLSHGAALAVMDAARLGSRDCGPLSPQPGSAAAAW